ncbi:hypothetical protein [Serratia oryzae]|uniref:Uncharacterized protein n=1 Tax=Serratia oryzae TaxID=2034155 RepID=A0A1S8CLR8_9GAMM|nr:hypothetical protein [Serratia oryzae]OMQ23702.1 hypothetical protein BMI79_09325 [Serratia oryzae]
MRKDAYWLINDGRSAPLEDVEELRQVAVGIHDSIVEGISAIGSLMFWAAESENYDADQAKADMFKLGDMLHNIARMAQGAMHAEENLAYRLREKK